jgi:hypothetical protein
MRELTGDEPRAFVKAALDVRTHLSVLHLSTARRRDATSKVASVVTVETILQHVPATVSRASLDCCGMTASAAHGCLP